MMEPESRIVHTMIDGACRQDFNQANKSLPFEVELRNMVCYKAWKRTVIEIDHKMPIVFESEEEESEGD